MPVTYDIDNELLLVITTASGVLTAPEAFAHKGDLANDPKFNPGFNQLIDFTQVKELVMTTDQLRSLASRSVFLPRVRRALLVQGTMQYGVGRMLTTFRELAGGTEQVQIFQNRTEAINWLLARSDNLGPPQA